MVFINLSSHFKRTYNNLPLAIQEDFKLKIKVFINDPYHPTLKTHKLKGRLQECLAFRLIKGYRVLFELVSSDTVNLLDVGSHDLYRRY